MFAADFDAAFTDLEVTGVMAAQARAANGITWTSASGVFLTQPVPEPGTWSMLLMGGAGHRRRGAQAAAPLTRSDPASLAGMAGA
jgi:hypothetical protein